jgi:hypothetical protein
MPPKELNDQFREMLKSGKEVLVACWDGRTTVMVQILSIDEDGNREYTVLGRRPAAIARS